MAQPSLEGQKVAMNLNTTILTHNGKMGLNICKVASEVQVRSFEPIFLFSGNAVALKSRTSSRFDFNKNRVTLRREKHKINLCKWRFKSSRL
jgi:hypothetical protein